MNYFCSKQKIQISLNLRFLIFHLHSVSNPLILSSFRCEHTYNPLKKKPFSRKLQISDKTSVNRICVTILGNGGLGQPRCIGLFTDHKGILFNCGEGIGRILREHEASFHQIKHIFVTRKDWCNLSGIPDIYLTLDIYGIHKLNVFGPPGIEHFQSLLTADISQAKLEKRSTPYIDDTFEIKSVSIVAERSSITAKNRPKKIDDVVFSYICKISEKPADLSPGKLIKNNVPFGPHLKKLRNREDIILPSGRIIRSADVIESSNEEAFILMVDCPSEDYLISFVTKGDFSYYQETAGNKVLMVFHFSPPSVMRTKLYQSWMKKFHSETQHIVLNNSCSTISSDAVYRTQSIFNLLHPEIFKLLPHTKCEIQAVESKSNLLSASSMLQLQIRPRREINWNNVVNYDPEWFIEETKYYSNFNKELNILKSAITSESNYLDEQQFPEVIFFGTSSATSTAYRNVTAILVNINETESVLLDCGEGTVTQLVRYFGSETLDSELQKISCIFISHLHTDHYLGLFQLIQSRIKSFENAGKTYQPLALILPYKILEVLKCFSMIFDPFILKKIRIFTCTSLGNRRGVEYLRKYLRDIQIETVPVKHCLDAHGIVLKHNDWKIVYSGDSAPCQKLIEAGKNCTLLIHEASIEDGCLNEAMTRKHSTPSQVIDISEKINAQHTILTHFSKRYLAVPVFENTNNKAIGCAFDFMKVRLNQLPLIPLFLPVMKCLFQEQLENHAVRTSFYENFENSFFKTYKQKTKSESL